MLILPLAYLGNIRWFSKILSGDYVIDPHENYVKKSYRNRCEILTVNGPVSLTVPVVHCRDGQKRTVAQTRIDYSKRWQHTHWQSIVSAYRGSPYFDHYAPGFEPYYSRRYEFLADFNTGLLKTVLNILGEEDVNFSNEYVEPGTLSPGDTDYRTALSPKPAQSIPDPLFAPARYWQVFADRHGFVPDLSVLDLIFCEGPMAPEIIRGSMVPAPEIPIL